MNNVTEPPAPSGGQSNGKVSDVGWDWSGKAMQDFLAVLFAPNKKMRPKEAMNAAMAVDGGALFAAQLDLFLRAREEVLERLGMVLRVVGPDGAMVPLKVDGDLLRLVVFGEIPDDVNNDSDDDEGTDND